MGATNPEDFGERRLIDSDVFRDVIGRFASGVTVVTTRNRGTNFGITASSVASVSLEPPMVLVCINRKTGTCYAVAESKVFGINILGETQGHIARRFAQPHTDKFKEIDIDYGQLGEPLLKEGLAYLECRVVEEVAGGTHSVFLAEVQNAWAREGMPLAYYRGKFGRFCEAKNDVT